MQDDTDDMMQPIMSTPKRPSKEKKWMIISIVSAVLLVAVIITAIAISANSKKKVTECEQNISNLELDVVAAQTGLTLCTDSLEDSETQRIGEIEASAQQFGFQYPYGTHVLRHLQPPTVNDPIISFRLDDSVIETCSECGQGSQDTLVIHTYDLSKLELEEGQTYASYMIGIYGGEAYEDVNTEKESSQNGTMTVITGTQVDGPIDGPISFETYIFEADQYVVVAYLDVSGGEDDGIVNFFHETLDTSKIQ